MRLPVPGTEVRGSRTGAPINAIFDLLGRRWALGVIWNLGRGPATFRRLQELCETISPSILNSRLKELRAADIVERGVEGYQLTERGQSLWHVLEPMGKWSVRWAREVFGFELPLARGAGDEGDGES